jgi:hypothetical protein
VVLLSSTKGSAAMYTLATERFGTRIPPMAQTGAKIRKFLT